MRIGVAAAVCIVAAGCGGAATRTSVPKISVRIEPGLPYPSLGGTSVGTKPWQVDVRVRIRFPLACARGSYVGRTLEFFNGRRRTRRSQPHTFGSVGPARAGATRVFLDEVDGQSGESVRLLVRIECNGRVGTASRTFALPTASCDGGPLRAYDVEGRVRWQDDYSQPSWTRLRVGDLLLEGARVQVARGGRAEIGAAECDGYSAVLGAGSYSTGTYDEAGGAPWLGDGLTMRADAHGGGYENGGIVVAPLTGRCDNCETGSAALFAVRTLGDTTAVRVTHGEVRLAAGATSRRVLAGEETSATCTREGVCTIRGPRLAQPGEPLSFLLAGRLPQFAGRATSGAGRLPATSALAPPFATTEVTPLARGAAAQLLVVWARETRTEPGDGANLQEEHGALVWQRVDATHWRVIYARRYARSAVAFLGTSVGDVNGDGRPDVVLEEENGGTAGCGIRRVLGIERGRAVELYRRYVCDGDAVIRDGRVELALGVGPCPFADGGAHCFGGVRTTWLRWRGTKLVERRVGVRCNGRRLDPHRDCRRRR